VEFREYFEKEQKRELELLEIIIQSDSDWMRHDETLLDIVKGAGRVAKGAVQSGVGIMSMGDEALSRLVGDPTTGRMKSGWDRFARGAGNVAGGVKQALVGGSPSPEPRPQMQAARQAKQQPPPPAGPRKKKQIVIRLAKGESPPPGLESLVAQYKASKDPGERDRLLAVISMKYSKWIQPNLERARREEMARGRVPRNA
jgi:hypothetical protein